MSPPHVGEKNRSQRALRSAGLMTLLLLPWGCAPVALWVYLEGSNKFPFPLVPTLNVGEVDMSSLFSDIADTNGDVLEGV